MRTFFKVTITIVSLFGIIFGLIIPLIMVLDIAEVSTFLQDETRVYTYSFYDKERLIYEINSYRGSEVDFSIVKDLDDVYMDNGDLFIFEGWDWTGDGKIDTKYPKLAYYSFDAYAIYTTSHWDPTPSKTSSSNMKGGM